LRPNKDVIGGSTLLTGPLVSALSNKLGIRLVTIIGSVMASVFFVISSFSVNIDMMLVTYGIMGGSFVFLALNVPSVCLTVRPVCALHGNSIYFAKLY